ncbi:DUF445 domain-containing protein [Pedococcus cremeus]|uniref:DUF445 domain-containing protein n=1 Tax=Pedococcus cremeus TaxID=587636 RepID=UPI000B873318|nr:DUF445 domain-containing protein [Pedococcus cremeus]
MLGIEGSQRDRQRLRRMKTRASLLLVLVGVLWIASYLVAPQSTASEFLRAAAEAGMVGGLADWFAVTALFKHPLGLPIPHTALIPRKKDELAASLGQFVTENFLSPETVRDHVRSLGVVGRTARWVAQENVARMLSDRGVEMLTTAMRSADPSVLGRLTTGALRSYTDNHSTSAALGRLMDNVVVARTHEPLLDVLLKAGADAIEENQAALAQQLKAIGERSGFLVSLVSTTRRAEKILTQVTAALRAAGADRDHDLRTTVNDLLERVAQLLKDDTAASRRIDGEIRNLVHHPGTEAWVQEQVGTWIDAVVRMLSRPDAAAEDEIAKLIRSVATRVLEDDELAEMLERQLEQVVVTTTERHGHQLTDLIRTKVELWSPKETADRFELAAGRDLQFIRINGTVVGALAGVAIHALSLLLV